MLSKQQLAYELQSMGGQSAPQPGALMSRIGIPSFGSNLAMSIATLVNAAA
jgi:hypothetical protein